MHRIPSVSLLSHEATFHSGTEQRMLINANQILNLIFAATGLQQLWLAHL